MTRDDLLAIWWPNWTPFERFHDENPHVYHELVKLCRRAKASGYQRWSVKAAFEVLRWSHMETTGEEWKLNNNYHAAYARLIMDSEPDLEGFFETRGGTE